MKGEEVEQKATTKLTYAEVLGKLGDPEGNTIEVKGDNLKDREG